MKTLPCIDGRYEIPDPLDRLSEFEVQAQLYGMLRLRGVEVRGEVAWLDPISRIHCRFDLVIYDGPVPLHILEVKHHQVSHKTSVEDTRQGRRYRLFGVPVTFIYGIDDAMRFVEKYMNGGFDAECGAAKCA